MGCHLEVDITAVKVAALRGNACKRGETYAGSELFDPRRTLTTTVTVKGGVKQLVPVKTKEGIPKAGLRFSMEVLRRLVVNAPIRTGDVLVEDLLGTGISVVACADVGRREKIVNN